MDVTDAVRSLGGVASLEQMRARGYGRAEILAGRRRGELMLVRRGWCATRDADTRLVQAVRTRGLLTCISATRLLGIWTLDDGRLHVAVPGNGSRLNPRFDGAPEAIDDPRLALHWRDATLASTEAVQPLDAVLQHVVECRPFEEALAIIDSVLHEGHRTRTQLTAQLTSSTGRRLVAASDAKAGAGGESIVRHRLRCAGIRVTTQHHVPGVGFVDMLLGDRVIVEIDGRDFHARVEGFDSDRIRDRELQRRGYVVLRFTYREVLQRWDSVLEIVLDFVRADRHRRRASAH